MTILAAAGLAAGLATAAAADGARLGLLHHEVSGVPGTLEPSGREVASGSLVKAMQGGVLLRLDNGQLLRLAPNSAARLDAVGGGGVHVTVLSGQAASVDPSGRPLFAGQRSTFTLAPVVQDMEAAEARLLEIDLSGVLRREPHGRRAAAGDR